MMNTAYDKIKDTRIYVMGFAALWIMLFHSAVNTDMVVISWILGLGYLGVDIFMFLSGFSMAHSFVQSCDCDAQKFIKNRLSKVLNTVFPFAILGIVLQIHKDYPTRELLRNAMQGKVFWIELFTFRWFIPCIIFCYCMVPLIHSIFARFGYRLRIVLIMILPILLISFFFVGSSVALMFLLRVPEFVLGYFYGGGKVGKTYIGLRLVLLCMGGVVYWWLMMHYSDIYLADTGLYWWPAIPLASSIVLVMAQIFEKIRPKFIMFMGRYSLELYLWHMFIMDPLVSALKKVGRFGDVIMKIIAILVTVFIAWLYAEGIQYCQKWWRKVRVKKEI